MDVHEVDERTTSWEVETPVFRVRMARTPADGPVPGSYLGAVVSTWDVTGASLADVRKWARETAPPGAAVSIGALVHDAERGLGVVWVEQ